MVCNLQQIGGRIGHGSVRSVTDRYGLITKSNRTCATTSSDVFFDATTALSCLLLSVKSRPRLRRKSSPLRLSALLANRICSPFVLACYEPAQLISGWRTHGPRSRYDTWTLAPQEAYRWWTKFCTYTTTPSSFISSFVFVF